MLQPEEWRAVVGYEGLYEVSDQGRVRGIDRVVGTAKRPVRWKGRVLRPAPTGKYKHLMVNLRKNGGSKSHLVHALVLTAFVGPRPTDMESCHGPGGTQDNRLLNLRWDTSSENNFDIVRQGKSVNANKKRCSRGHLLSGPNLYSYSRRGKCKERVCKACCIARTLVKRFGRGDVTRFADESYRCSLLGIRVSWIRLLETL
jgi:hypothetical protein